MAQTHAAYLSGVLDDRTFASPEELKHQAAFFAEVFLTRHLLDALPETVLILNRYRQIVFANRAFCRLTGRSELDGLVGLLVGDALSCHVGLGSEAGCGTGESCQTCGALMAMLAGLAGEECSQECVLTRQDGINTQNLTLRIWAVPLAYGNELFTVVSGADISHERRRLALERTFFHDILNIVGSIRGFAELMEIDKNVDAQAIGRRIQFASQRIIDEIEAQRVLLAVEKGELVVDCRGLVTSEVLADMVALYEGQDVARRRFLKIDAHAVSTLFVSDPTLLRRILGNMIKNALEASPEGDTVTVGVDENRGSMDFWVHNSAAIPVVYQQRIFQRDFSTKGSGRGLGTYSMRLLARFLNGDIRFESSTDGGTRFTLSLSP